MNSLESPKRSPVEVAIESLNASRRDTNTRLKKQDLELVRKTDEIVELNDNATNESQRFSINTVENAEGDGFDGAYELLSQTFEPEELDTRVIMAEQMNGLRYGQRIETGARAVIFTISKDKEVVGTLSGAVINLQDEKGEFNSECIFMVFYIAAKDDEDPKKNYRQMGFGRELMISAYEYAQREANSRDKQLIGAAGECTYTSRTFWEKMDWRRAYTQEKDDTSNLWKEVSYVQPPLAFDTRTGEVAEGAGDAPEHLMVNLFDKEANQTPEKLTRIVKGFYGTNNYIPRSAFATDEAYTRHQQNIDPHLSDFVTQLQGKKIRFLTEAEIISKHLMVEDCITGEAEAKLLGDVSSAAVDARETNDDF